MSRVQRSLDLLSKTAARKARAHYYRFLYGRHIPFTRFLAQRIERHEQRSGAQDGPMAPDVWNQQYQAGVWNYLEQADEFPRYSIIAGYLVQMKPDASVLDVGCGEGILFRRYRPHGYVRYVGVDLSSQACDKLKASVDERTSFVCADAESFGINESFDAIVFNETLYYFKDPVRTLRRYARALNPEGILIVSTYLGSRRARAILRAAKAAFPVVDETEVKRGAKTWTCSVLVTESRIVPKRVPPASSKSIP